MDKLNRNRSSSLDQQKEQYHYGGKQIAKECIICQEHRLFGQSLSLSPSHKGTSKSLRKQLYR